VEAILRQFAIEICRLAGGANKCKGIFDARQLPVTMVSKASLELEMMKVLAKEHHVTRS
jgi:hypothetical protein